MELIVQYPNDILTTISKRITRREFTRVAELLRHAYRSIPSAGVAAPQVGINKQAFIALGEIYFNPTIIKYIGSKQECREGCLSIKEKGIPVPRYDEIILSWMDQRGNAHTSKFTGWTAEVLQHECDHLKGKLLIDYKQTEMPLHTDRVYRYTGR
jgi:peptide deformylase